MRRSAQNGHWLVSNTPYSPSPAIELSALSAGLKSHAGLRHRAEEDALELAFAQARAALADLDDVLDGGSVMYVNACTGSPSSFSRDCRP